MMKYSVVVLLALLGMVAMIEGHPGHSEWVEAPSDWLDRIGKYHYVFNHFPVALIVMTAVAEGLGTWTRKENFYHAARFMIASAAFLTPLAALLGLALVQGTHYDGAGAVLIEWHRNLGLASAFLAILTGLFSEGYYRGWFKGLIPYYICLTLLFVCVCWTAMLGGTLTFGF